MRSPTTVPSVEPSGPSARAGREPSEIALTGAGVPVRLGIDRGDQSSLHLGSSGLASLRPLIREHPTTGRATDPAVSVVIPTRDRLGMLLQAVRSVLAQQHVEVEILVVDDGSRDPVQGLIGSLDDPRVRVLRQDTARGVSRARNTGAAAAGGEWVAFLDDDDLWAPTKLARQVGVGEDAAPWGYAGAVHVNQDLELLGGEPPPSPQRLVTDLTRRNRMPAGSSNVIARAELFRSTGGFDEGLRHLADWDLWLRLARDSMPFCVPEPLVAYRLHTAQATLDTSGMISEGRILRARHGVDLNSVRRWLAWSELRRGHRGRAMLSYLRAALSGDVTSIGRAAVVAIRPSIERAHRTPPTPEDEHWADAASGWIEAAVVPPG